jgi:hypothetical protein
MAIATHTQSRAAAAKQAVKGSTKSQTAAPPPSNGKPAAVVTVTRDATLHDVKAAQINAGNDLHLEDGSATMMRAGHDLYATDAGAAVMVAGHNLTLTNGGAAVMAAGQQLHLTNGGAGVLWAGHTLTVHNGGGTIQAAGQQVTLDGETPLVVAAQTVKATHSAIALAIGYDVHVEPGAQAIVAVSLRSFVETLVGVVCFLPVQGMRQVKKRLTR